MSTEPGGLRAVQLAIWTRSKPEVDRRVAAVARAVVGLLEGCLSHTERATARSEAHKLAGAAGSFGFPSASQVALELEDLLAAPDLDPSDGDRAAHLVRHLRAALDADAPVDDPADPTLPDDDVLTGLPNGSGLREAWERRALASEVSPVALAVLDVDDLPYITDVHGRQASARVVQDVAAALRAGTAERDCVARLGACRFGALVHRSPAEVVTLLLAALRDLRRRRGVSLGDGRVVRVSVSGGVVPAHPGERFEDACRAADSLTVRAQALGGDRIVVGSVPAPDNR